MKISNGMGKIINKYSLLIFLTFFVLGFLLIYNQNQKLADNIKYVKIAGQTLKVELALTQETQAQGLSGKNSLKEDEGMLFVFKNPDKYKFWMKEMNFVIDIIWISIDNKVIYIKKDALPESYPETFRPNENAKYVLEVVSRFSEKNNLKIGDRVEFDF